jgi:hypothetical protein
MTQLIIFFICLCLLSACNSNTGEDNQLPSRVMMVMRSPDTASVEQGIDALPESNNIQVQWHKSYHPALKYYHLWRKAGNELYYRRIKIIDPERTSQGGDTTYIDTVLDTLKWYNYFVAAANKDGNEGAPSDTARYMLLEKATLESPDQEVIDRDYIFKWEFNGDVPPQEFILRIEENFTKKVVYSRIFWNENLLPGLYTFNLSEKEPDLAFPRGNYRWRIDCIGEDAESSGSESGWLHFSIE